MFKFSTFLLLEKKWAVSSFFGKKKYAVFSLTVQSNCNNQFLIFCICVYGNLKNVYFCHAKIAMIKDAKSLFLFLAEG